MLFERQLKDSIEKANTDNDYINSVLADDGNFCARIAEKYNNIFKDCLVYNNITKEDVAKIITFTENLPFGFKFLLDSCTKDTGC